MKYVLKKLAFPPETAIFSDIGWRALLKAAISRTDARSKKRETLRRFHEEYDYLCAK